MKKWYKNQKVIIPLFIVLGLFIIIGTSYALWQITLQQTDTNVITTGCLKLTLTEETDAINLIDVSPTSDEDGKKLMPYTFTIENTCTTDTNYVINLETISTGDKILADNYVKAYLISNTNQLFLDKLLTKHINEEKVITDATSAYKLYQGTLGNKEKKQFSLRLWLDEDTSAIDEVMNATWQGKVTITANYINNNNTTSETAVSYIQRIAPSDDSLVDDETVDHNIRYIGANPSNYVNFNGELWRIIGVMNNVKTSEDDVGESRLKIIKATPYGEAVKFAESDSITDWNNSSIKVLLNSTYLDTLNSDKDMISDTLWQPGSKMQENTYKPNNDANGILSKIGLMSTTDYGYATSGGTTTTRDVCLATKFKNWNSSDVSSDCKDNNYLYSSLYDKWTLDSYPGYIVPVTLYINGVHIVSATGEIQSLASTSSMSIFPVVHLNTNVKFTSGDGSIDNPYQLSL